MRRIKLVISSANKGMTPVDYALEYARVGLSVVPIETDGTKKPVAGLTWKGFQSAIASEPEIRRLFKAKGVAIICGQVSGNLETLDIDDPELVAPFEAAVNELAPGLLAKIPTVATPRNNYGGRHYRYRVLGTVAGNTKLAQSELRPQFKDDGTPEIDPRTGKQRMAPETLIETRGEGGYAIAPGSPGECHETGLCYQHCSGPPLTEIPTLSTEEHDLLWRVAKSFNRYIDPRDVKIEPATNGSADRPGDHYNQTANWADILLPAGWTVAHTSGELTYWRRPGKASGISATTGVRGPTGADLLCVFSSNAFPLEGPANGKNHTCYSKFAAYAALNHSGDFAAAAISLKAAGYGATSPPKSATAPSPRKFKLAPAFRPFPTDMLPLGCAEFVRQAAASIDCDESMIALPLLATLAAAIGNSCRIALKRDYSEPATVWAAVVSESGSRKSPAVESPIRPLRRREAEQIKRFKEEQKEFERLLQEFRAEVRRRKAGDGDLPDAPPEPPVCQRLTVSDVTTEALAVRLEHNPRGLLLARDELAGFFGGMNQYKSGGKGGDEAVYLAMHGARTVMVDRKNADKPQIYVPYANLSVVGGIQPGVLRRALTRDRMESGMAARFVMTYPPPRIARWSEESVDVGVENQLATVIDNLLSLEMAFDQETGESAPNLLPMTPEAKQHWIAFHDEHAIEQADLHGDLSAAWAKLTGYAPRFALIYELANWAALCGDPPPTHVSAEAVQAGIELAKWFSYETKRIYAILEECDEARGLRELVDYIRRQGGTITARQVARGPRRYRNNSEQAEADLQRLVDSRAGHWANRPSADDGGRPTRTFCLFPHLLGDETPANPDDFEVSSPSPVEMNAQNSGQGGKDEAA